MTGFDRFLAKQMESPSFSEGYERARAAIDAADRAYATIRAQVRQLQDEGRLPKTLTRDEKIDWAYGNTAIENPSITREMVEAAHDARGTSWR